MTSAAATATCCQRHGSGRSSGPKIRRSAAVHQSELIGFAASKTARLCWRCRSTGSGDTIPNSGGVAGALPAMESLGSAAPGWPKMALVERGPCRASRTKLSALRLRRHQGSAVVGYSPRVWWRSPRILVPFLERFGKFLGLGLLTRYVSSKPLVSLGSLREAAPGTC
jgi:hypothetical protein